MNYSDGRMSEVFRSCQIRGAHMIALSTWEKFQKQVTLHNGKG